MAVDSASGTAYLAFEDNNNGNLPTVMKYNGSAWVPVGVGIIDSNGTGSISLAINKSGLSMRHILILTLMLLLKPLTNKLGNLDNNTNVNGNSCSLIAIVCDNTGAPVVAFSETVTRTHFGLTG